MITRRSSVNSLAGISLSDGVASGNGAGTTHIRHSHSASANNESGDMKIDTAQYDRAAALAELYRDLSTPQHVLNKVYGKSHTLDTTDIAAAVQANAKLEGDTELPHRSKRNVISQSQSMQVAAPSEKSWARQGHPSNGRGGENPKKKHQARQMMEGMVYGAIDEPCKSHPTAFQY